MRNETFLDRACRMQPKVTISRKAEKSPLVEKLEKPARETFLQAVEPRVQELILNGMGRGEAQVQALDEENYSGMYVMAETGESMIDLVAKIPKRPERKEPEIDHLGRLKITQEDIEGI